MLQMIERAPTSGDFGALLAQVMSIEGFEGFALTGWPSGVHVVSLWHPGRRRLLFGRGASACGALKSLLERQEAFEARGNRTNGR